MKHLCVHGKGGKIRYIPAHPRAIQLLEEFLDAAGHQAESESPLFRAVAPNLKGSIKRLSPDSVYRNVVMYYCRRLGIEVEGMSSSNPP